MMTVLLQRRGIRQFIKFCIVGFVNTGLDWATFFALTGWVDWFHATGHILVANALAFAVGFTSSFVFNRRWTFRSQEKRVAQQITRFLLINLVGLGISQVIVGTVFHFTDSRLLSKTLAVAVTLFWNFLAGRRWAFSDGA